MAVSDEETLPHLVEWLLIILDQLLPFVNLQRLIDASQIDGAAISSYLAANGAGTELVWHWSVGINREFHSPAVAAALKFPVSIQCQIPVRQARYITYIGIVIVFFLLYTVCNDQRVAAFDLS